MLDTFDVIIVLTVHHLDPLETNHLEYDEPVSSQFGQHAASNLLTFIAIPFVQHGWRSSTLRLLLKYHTHSLQPVHSALLGANVHAGLLKTCLTLGLDML